MVMTKIIRLRVRARIMNRGKTRSGVFGLFVSAPRINFRGQNGGYARGGGGTHGNYTCTRSCGCRRSGVCVVRAVCVRVCVCICVCVCVCVWCVRVSVDASG